MEKNYDYVFKIVLLGGSYSGKTCLLGRYVDDIYKIHMPTGEANFKTKSIEFDKHKIKLKIWDTWGSNCDLAKVYFRSADGIIFFFFFNYKNTLKDIDYYINDVKKERNKVYDSIICANCCDFEFREITKEEINNYEQKYNIKIFETSAKIGLNINEAFNYLIYQILKRKSNKQVLSSFENWSNIQINYYKISLFKEPICKNIFKNQYYYNINGKYIQLNIIDNNSYLDADGLIFYFDVEYKDSFEYILNKINTIDEYYLNNNRTIIIYKTDKYKEDILIKKELDNLCNKKGINIFNVFGKNDIKEGIEKLVIKINDDELERTITNKLNKYINF